MFMVPFQHLSVCPSVCTSEPAPTHPSAKFEPCKCPHWKVIIHYAFIVSKLIINMHPCAYSWGSDFVSSCNCAELSHCRNKPHETFQECSLTLLLVVKQFILDFQYVVPLQKYFSETKANCSDILLAKIIRLLLLIQFLHNIFTFSQFFKHF